MATATAVAPPVVTAMAPVNKVPRQLSVPNSDFYQLVDLLTAVEKTIVTKVRAYHVSGSGRISQANAARA